MRGDEVAVADRRLSVWRCTSVRGVLLTSMRASPFLKNPKVDPTNQSYRRAIICTGKRINYRSRRVNTERQKDFRRSNVAVVASDLMTSLWMTNKGKRSSAEEVLQGRKSHEKGRKRRQGQARYN
ncbi:hypothetical protein VTL71DRAFT_12842 [Oculimacula yallundae]|uniref:50S ribosomal protein L28 n=1 Tax=Oculimacula yallundae TaxID=86028 RepID=A0ABR4CPC4_9HELO